jgi:putative two-component system response regulator
MSGLAETPAQPLASSSLSAQDRAMPAHAHDHAPVDSEAPLILIAGTVPDATEALLREAGCHVRKTVSAAAALRLAAEVPGPRLVLVGDTVGEHSGLEVVSRLREQPATRRLPLLYLGGGDEELALALGANDCLSLPLRPLVLLARVQAQLRLQRLAELTAPGVLGAAR